MTLGEAANWAAVIGIPALVFQLVIADRTRAASEQLDQLLVVAQQELAVLDEKVAIEDRKRAFAALLNSFESLARLLNGWLVSIWSRELWFNYLLATIDRFASQSPYQEWIFERTERRAGYRGLKKFVNVNRERLEYSVPVLRAFRIIE